MQCFSTLLHGLVHIPAGHMLIQSSAPALGSVLKAGDFACQKAAAQRKLHTRSAACLWQHICFCESCRNSRRPVTWGVPCLAQAQRQPVLALADANAGRARDGAAARVPHPHLQPAGQLGQRLRHPGLRHAGPRACNGPARPGCCSRRPCCSGALPGVLQDILSSVLHLDSAVNLSAMHRACSSERRASQSSKLA
jgi:hypothetical protein